MLELAYLSLFTAINSCETARESLFKQLAYVHQLSRIAYENEL